MFRASAKPCYAGSVGQVISCEGASLTSMWNLDDNSVYFKVLAVELPFSYTWGSDDLRKREAIRAAVGTQGAGKFVSQLAKLGVTA